LTIPNQTSDWSDSRICWLAALVVTVFIVNGSLVPFDLRWPEGLGPDAWLGQVRFTPWSLVSGTDVFVNLAVGMPLGFFLMGGMRSGRRGAGILAAIAATGLSALLGTAVELLQVLSQLRQSSWNDVMAQSLGAGIGAAGWMAFGPRVSMWWRHLASEREPSIFAARLLQLYLPFYLLVQLTPFEAIRAAELPQDPQSQIVLVAAPVATESVLVPATEFAGNALLSVPIGMLAVVGWMSRGKRRPVIQALALGSALVLAVGVAPGSARWNPRVVSELLADVLGVVIGVVAAAATWWRTMASESFGENRRLRPWLLFAASAWTLVLVAQAWQPSNYGLTSMAPFDSYRLYLASPLQALRESVLEFLVAFPLGFLLRLACPVPGTDRIRRLQAILLIGVVMLLLSAVGLGRALLPMREHDAMDVLIGAAGGMVGLVSGGPFLRRQNTA